ncbi:hypothetical protein BT93_E0088 [Corymbia citriodora subsp. variegata]|nr:hypothetical protein BT93_E0088 [Corymbia citriodora subsp. variegata]
MATLVIEDKLYVAVGKDVKESKLNLVWTARQSGANVKICIIHVLVPSQRIPGGLGVGIPARSANEKILREHREKERINTHKILNTHLRFCEQLGVQAEKEYIESKSIENGIMELIRLHGIRKLVMGAAANNYYFREMTEIKSRKAVFVRDNAHISCQIWFICGGHLIHARKAPVFAEVPTDAPSPPLTPSPRDGKTILSKLQSATLQRSGTTKLSNSSPEILRRASSSNSDSSPSPSSTPLEQPNATSMLERQDPFQELAHLSRRLSHRMDLTRSVYHTGHSSLSNTLDMNENNAQEVLGEEVATCVEAEADAIGRRQKDPRKGLYAEKLEEELEKVKDQLDKVMEELRIAETQKLQLEDQFLETDQSRKELKLKMIATDEMMRTFRQERELLQIDLENALQKAEEMSRRKGDSSSTTYFSEFSMTEIKEAAWNFDPSLKIGEGGCGSVYRGFLRHTPVAIKIMKFPSMQGSQEFQQEVDVLSKVRHPNLITLIGAYWLRSRDKANQLPWQARIHIATELCSVLAFLHSCKPHSIVHGDVKPGNILLDAHLVSKLSDFGICRLLSSGERSSNNTTVVYSTNPKGTFGYMDPEFLVTRELTTKFDVYSFGIILLQLLTRKPALGIVNEVQRAIEAETLQAILDPLAGEWPYTLAEKLTHMALRCCEMSRKNRPDLRSDVWTLLQSIEDSCQ